MHITTRFSYTLDKWNCVIMYFKIVAASATILYLLTLFHVVHVHCLLKTWRGPGACNCADVVCTVTRGSRRSGKELLCSERATLGKCSQWRWLPATTKASAECHQTQPRYQWGPSWPDRDGGQRLACLIFFHKCPKNVLYTVTISF